MPDCNGSLLLLFLQKRFTIEATDIVCMNRNAAVYMAYSSK